MILFPTVIGLLLLVLVAQVVLIIPAAGRTFYRERRFTADRPRMRAVLLLTVVEIAILLVWSFYVLGQIR
jgi:hypothetical protein